MQPRGQSWDYGLGVSATFREAPPPFANLSECVSSSGRMGAHQREGELRRGPPHPPPSCRVPPQPAAPAAPGTSQRQRRRGVKHAPPLLLTLPSPPWPRRRPGPHLTKGSGVVRSGLVGKGNASCWGTVAWNSCACVLSSWVGLLLMLMFPAVTLLQFKGLRFRHPPSACSRLHPGVPFVCVCISYLSLCLLSASPGFVCRCLGDFFFPP